MRLLKILIVVLLSGVVVLVGSNYGWFGSKARAALQMSWKTADGWVYSFNSDPVSMASTIWLDTPCSEGSDRVQLVQGTLASRDLAKKLANFHDHPYTLSNLESIKLSSGDEMYVQGPWVYTGRRCDHGHIHNATYTAICNNSETANLVLHLLNTK